MVVMAASTTRICTIAFGKKFEPLTTKLPSPLACTEIEGLVVGGGGVGGAGGAGFALAMISKVFLSVVMPVFGIPMRVTSYT